MKKLPIVLIIPILLFASLSPKAWPDTPLAKIGERTITLEELQKVLTSTPYGMPKTKNIDPGSKEVMVRMLSDMIDAELLYAEAVKTGIAKTPAFKKQSAENRKTLLAVMYREKVLSSRKEANPAEVKKFAEQKNVSEESAQAMLNSQDAKKSPRERGKPPFRSLQCPLLHPCGQWKA